MLLIVDEEQTGLGKLGQMFGFESEGIVPDIVTIAKHFGGGVGISALITTCGDRGQGGLARAMRPRTRTATIR